MRLDVQREKEDRRSAEEVWGNALSRCFSDLPEVKSRCVFQGADVRESVASNSRPRVILNSSERFPQPEENRSLLWADE